jgi:hypothetical protein
MISQVTLSKILKGLYSAALTFLASLSTIVQGPESFSAVTAGQWLTIATLTLTAFGGTFGLAGWSGPTTGPAPPKGK